MKKRILATFLSLALVLSLSPVHVSAVEKQTHVDPATVTDGALETPAVHTEELDTEDMACAGLPGCGGEVHDPECPLYTAPAGENVIYVSQSGNKDADGTSADKATTLAHATTLANEQAGPVTITVIGSVSVEDWDSPTVDTTVVGQDEESELLFEYCSAGDYEANIDMQGALTIDRIKLNVHYTKPGLVSSMPPTGTFTIVANGHPLEITAGAKYIYDTSRTNVAHIIGGSLGKDLEGNTSIKICTALPVTYVVGGCYDGTLTGDTKIWMEDSTVQYVVGGGEADQKDSNVIGSTNITVLRTDIKNFMCGGGWAGQFPSANANVAGNTKVHFENTKSGRVQVYGGGVCTSKSYTATVGGSVSITSKSNDMSHNNGTVYGGGAGSSSNMDNAKVSGDISIKVEDGYSFGYVYGGGHQANVDGNVSIEVSGNNQNSSPSIYGGGEGSTSSNCPHIAGAVDITLKGVQATVCSLGKNGTVGGKVTINLQGGGGNVKDAVFTENILNADASYINWAGNVTGTPVYYENTEVVVSDGTFVATTIYGAPQITIKDGGVLQEQREYAPTNNKPLFKDVKNVTIESGGTLALLQTNGISGNFSGAGTLTMPKAAELVAGSQVTVQDGAMYIPTDGYEKGDVFLKSQTGFTQGSQPEFMVSEAGNQSGYFTKNHVVSGDAVQHEWYVEQLFTLKPLELTKYMAGDHDHEKDENCFPDPRFEGCGENTEIKVAGEIWDKDAHKGQYPFQIMYYPLPENYDLKDFPDGITDEHFKVPIENDYEAGSYIARVEPNVGIKMADITIDGSAVKTALSLLRIRKVEKVDQVGDDIGKLASQVTETAPTQKITEAVAVMPEDMTYLVNNIEGQGLNPEPDVRLLHDELLSVPGQDTCTDALIARLEKEGVTQDSTRRYAMKYLDLIDANDSNLLVCAQSEYQIYVPYPAGTDESTEFTLYHFGGLNRTYTEQDYGENVFTNIENSTVTRFNIENTPAGIVFKVNPPPETQRDNYSIGAMALTWKQKQYTVTFDSDGGTQVPNQTVTEGQTASEPADPTRSGYDFEGWYLGDEKYDFSSPVTSSITLTAHWSKRGGGGGGGGGSSVRYTLCYDSNGGTEYRDEEYRRNTVVKLDKTPERKGYTFTGWYADRKLTDKISSIQMTSDKTVYAGWRHDYTPADLNSKDHVSYVSGYPDGTVRPDAPITRAETATMIYRLLTDARRAEIDTEVNSFGDVSSSDWFVRPVSTMANGGYIVGYPDGTFGGSKQITRAEFVTMLVRFIGLKDAECSFHDVSQNHWAYRFIAMATDAGWIAGYTDGTFAPDQTITRAEAMTILNSVLNRGVNEKSELLNFKVWPDNPQTAWYYYEVIEASNGHEYTGARPSEDWTKLVKDLL